MTGKVTADISMSLDGFITGPNAGPGNGLGDGGRLFDGMDRDTSLETMRVIDSPAVTHLKFRVVNRKKDAGGALPSRREEA